MGANVCRNQTETEAVGRRGDVFPIFVRMNYIAIFVKKCHLVF